MEAHIRDLKALILKTASRSREGHIGSAFSILDILYTLYHETLRIDPQNPRAARDFFILSKGHGSLGLYAVLGSRGFFPLSELDGFCQMNSRFGGHPDACKVPGVEASTGSLGHGFPMAVGCALAQKIEGSSFKTYCLIGDGEANEGTVWESALLAAHHRLKNLTLIVDHNHSGDRALHLGSLQDKFISFGWASLICNGHNHKDLRDCLAQETDQPKVIIAETFKGKGCKSLENNPAWHHKSPNAEELVALLKELS